MSENAGKTSGHDEMVFNQVNTNVINKELENEKLFIKNEMCKIEKEHFKQWQELKNNIIPYKFGAAQYNISQVSLINEQGIDLMKEKCVKSDYKLSDMPFDNINGFKGDEEYDYNGYLTKLLMASHQIDPIFQAECKDYFEKLGNSYTIACKYASAPVKTRERAIVKAKLGIMFYLCIFHFGVLHCLFCWRILSLGNA